MKKILCLLVLTGATAAAFGQGSLAPPGAPAPTMKTLSQIEPRTAVASLPFNIAVPGSYYLTTNLTGISGTNGITISSGNVTLDLRGFTLAGVPGSVDGIATAGVVTNVTLENGTVTGWGDVGVNAGSAFGATCVRLTVSNNQFDGLDPGGYARISFCLASGNGQDGFGVSSNEYEGTYEDCTSIFNDRWGFDTLWDCTFLNCRAVNNNADGISAYYKCVLKDCSANYNGGYGIFAQWPGCTLARCQAAENGLGGIAADNSALSGCTANYNNQDGIDAGSGSSLSGCSVSFNAGQGINTLDNCTLSDCAANTNSLDNIATGSGCVLVHCSSGGSGGNGYVLGAGNNISASAACHNPTNGIDAGDRTAVWSCTASFNGNAGVHLGVLGTVRDSSCVNNGTYGILADNNGYGSIVQNICSYNGTLAGSGPITAGAGIYVTNSPGCRIEANTLDFNYAALVVAANNHALIIRNSADASVGTNFVFGAGNSWGPIVNASAGGDISTISNSSHPEANFIH